MIIKTKQIEVSSTAGDELTKNIERCINLCIQLGISILFEHNGIEHVITAHTNKESLAAAWFN